MKNGINPINLLWTSGWDSTYRLVELSRINVIVQPIYICGEGRNSEKYELKAMSLILEKLNKKPETEATILPIEYIQFESIKVSSEVAEAYNSISNKIHLGGQYEWLPSVALKYNNLEIGIEKAPPEQSGAINAITQFGEMEYSKQQHTYILDKDNSTNALNLIFGNMNFPIIDKDSKVMVENISEWGYEDVMQHVWMCFTPIFGKPCGTCNPCKSKIETNMEFLLEPISIRRYQNRKISRYYNGVLKILSSQIDKIRLRSYRIE